MWLALLLAAGAAVETPPGVEEQTLLELVKIRRVHVERLGGGETAAQMRDMIISSLQNSRLFLLTENPEKADAILRGSAEDLVFTDTFISSDGLSARASLSTGSLGTSSKSSAARGPSLSAGVGDQESTRIAERKHEATAAVRLVSKDGDVLWSTTKESQGSKFRGASADVAHKITQQLLEDMEKARKLRQKLP